MRPIYAGFLVLVFFVAGCASTTLNTYSKDAGQERVFGNTKKVAVLPFETVGEAGAGPKNVESSLVQKLLTNRTFQVVKEPRYVAGLMKKLKLRNAETLDKEIVQKIGQELQVDAIIVGALLLYGEDEKSTDVEFSVFLNMIDVDSGDIIWSGSNYLRSSTTWGEVFGLSEAPSVNNLAVRGIEELADEIDSAFVDSRYTENKIIMKQASEAVKVEEEEGQGKGAEEKETEELLLKVKPK